MGKSRDVLDSSLKYWSKEPVSEAGYRVAALLEDWRGLHHFCTTRMKKVDWTNPRWIELNLSNRESTGQLSTFDFSGLTSLVFLAHDHCIRVDLQPCNFNYLTLVFHPRDERIGGMSERHPTIEQALEQWRTNFSSLEVSGTNTEGALK